MTSNLIVLILFAAFSATAATILLFLRDVGLAMTASRSTSFRLRRLPPPIREDASAGAIQRFDNWLTHLARDAGYNWTAVTLTLFLLFMGLLAGGLVLIGTDSPLLAAGGFVMGTVLAVIILVLHRNRRIKVLQSQLPPALDMLARAVRAGESLDQAIELVGNKSSEPLATEFRRASKQLAMGISMSAVMRGLVHRVRMVDVRIFTTTLTVHRQTGGNLAWTLERLAAVIRDRLAYRRQMRVATSAGRWSAGLIALVGPLLFTYLFIVEPQYVEGLLADPIGQVLLFVAVLLEVAGLAWIYRMLRQD